jgi:predicted RNA-binding protein with PIN domain
VPNQRSLRQHHRQRRQRRYSGPVRARYLIVDGHSAIFGWPKLQRLHARRTSLARDALVKKLRDYQDYTGVRVVVVFDGKGTSATEQSEPHGIQVFYSRAGQTADAIIERFASKYAGKFDLAVATGDLRERETATAFGADCISIANLRAMIEEAVPD